MMNRNSKKELVINEFAEINCLWKLLMKFRFEMEDHHTEDLVLFSPILSGIIQKTFDSYKENLIGEKNFDGSEVFDESNYQLINNAHLIPRIAKNLSKIPEWSSSNKEFKIQLVKNIIVPFNAKHEMLEEIIKSVDQLSENKS